MILVDASLPGGLKKIQDEISKAGLDFDKLNRIIITH
jgi:glyoxylase-like metal-dependent hydrolase (beta-lactamase superfamily II)